MNSTSTLGLPGLSIPAMGSLADLVSGRELDALVAEHVMGWLSVRFDGLCWVGNPPDCMTSNWSVPHYSSNGHEMLFVLERLRSLRLFASIDQQTLGVFRITIYEHDTPDAPGRWTGDAIEAAEMPEAISRAALQAMQWREQENQ